MQNIHIPQLPHLETMFIHITHKSKCQISNIAALNSKFQRLDLKSHPIPQRFLLQLSSTPNLLAIRFTYSKPTEEKPEVTRQDRISHKASLWDRYNASGMLIRTYSNGFGENLVILRMRIDGCWSLYASMNDRQVQTGRLEAASRLMGEDLVGWDKPGRNLSLSEEAWETVRVC
jgi:hypothetical protein